jgi:uncharacterized iron-regulated protein
MMRAHSIPLLLAGLFWALFAHALQAAEREPWREWQTPLLRDHPLAGRIWSMQEKAFVQPGTLAKAVQDARFVLLGEIHDNADHHRLQAWLVGEASRGRKAALVMEMIPQDAAQKLADYLKRPNAGAAGLGAAIDWQKWGWPAWHLYQPIAEAAFGAKLPIRAGDVERQTLRDVGKKGLELLDIARRNELGLDAPLSAGLEDSLLNELYASHCELMPRSALSGMANVQRLRDAVLADSLFRSASGDGAILIAGNGHVRADRGVPLYLRAHAPQAAIVTVMILEVEADAGTAEDLLPKSASEHRVADYVWFTPRQDRESPCKGLAERLGKKR